MDLNNCHHSTGRQMPCIFEAKEKQLPSSSQCFAPENEKKPCFSAVKTCSETTKMSTACCSRGSMMVQMAVGADAIVFHKPQKPHQNFMITTKPTAISGSKFEPKELKPENIEYFSKIQSVVEASENVSSRAIEALK